MQLNGSEILMQALLEHEVAIIFGYPGGTVLNIYDALYDLNGRIEHITTVDEQGACYAANGYARSSGKTGVVLATGGPGATNLVTGIADAYMDSIPLVAITGNVAQNLIGRDAFQEVYIAGVTMPITKHNFVVRKVEDLPQIVSDAFRIANSGRKGPVLIDIPKDISAAVTEYIPAPPQPPEKAPTPDSAAIQDLANRLNHAERPLLYVGGGIISAEASKLLRQVMAKGQIAACHTIMGIGALDVSDPLNLGLVGMHGKRSCNMAVEHCDLLVALGVRFSDRVALNMRHFAPHATLVQVDIDPSEFNKNVAVDATLIGDVGDVLAALLPHLKTRDRRPWREALIGYQSEDFMPEDPANGLKPHQILQSIARRLSKDDRLVTDVGQHQIWAAQYGERSRPRTFISSSGLGAMGFGYGAAMGAYKAAPTAKIVHVSGDGSFHMNMNEIATAVQEGLPIISVIMDNKALGMPRQWQHYLYKDRYAFSDYFRQTDYVALAEAFGARGSKPGSIEAFRNAFDDALNHPGPSVIWCEIGRSEQVLPMIPGGGTVKDLIMQN